MKYYRVSNTLFAYNTETTEYFFAVSTKTHHTVGKGVGHDEFQKLLGTDEEEITVKEFQRQFAKAVDYLANETPFY